MWRPILAALVFFPACADAGQTSDPSCPCGSALRASDKAESFEDTLAEFAALACTGVTAFRGECSDGKTVLYINGGLGHTGLYYVDGQLVGSSRSTDIFSEGCPSNNYGGALEDVTCEIVSAEPLCPGSPYPGGRQLPDSLAIPFADGQLSPWCDPQRVGALPGDEASSSSGR
jgi:hypothetical protein